MFVNRGPRPVFVIPHEKERENVEELVGDDASIVFITTPGQVTLSSFTYSCVEKLVYEKEKKKRQMLAKTLKIIENLSWDILGSEDKAIKKTICNQNQFHIQAFIL